MRFEHGLPLALRCKRGLLLATSLLAELFLGQANAAPAASDFQLTATANDLGLYFPTYLANGFFSTQSSPRGTDPTLAQMAGLMDYTPGDVSRPAAIPSWSEVDYFNGMSWLNETPVTPTTLRDYQQTLDMHDGLLTTRYTWVDKGKATRIAILTFVSEDSSHLGVTSMTLTPEFDGPIKLRFTLRPWPAFPHRLALARLTLSQTKDAIAAAYGIPPPAQNALLSQVLKPATPTAANRAAIWYPGEVAVEAAEASEATRVLWVRGHAVNGARVAEAAALAIPGGLGSPHVRAERSPQLVTLEVTGSVVRDQPYVFTKFVAVSGARWGGSAVDDLRAAQRARVAGADALLARHEAAWHALWRSDILVEGDDSLQRAIHSDLFYLLENSSANTEQPMAACGFSPYYLGHVFWDNDSWDFPVLLLLHPERARSQIAFRFRTLGAAEERARAYGFRGAMFPWESDPARGTDETPYFAHENAAREIHVNGDVSIAQWQYYLASGDRDWLRERGFPVIRATAEFWTSRVVYAQATDRYEILHVTSPDEAYSDVNNDSFTNAIAQRNLQIATAAAQVLGVKPDARWDAIARKLYIPFSVRDQRHLDFDPSIPHDKRTWMGSALSFLAYPPLDLPMSAGVRRNDFNFAVRSLKELTPDANAMPLAMISLEAAELGDANAAELWLQRQQGGFVKPPFDVRSETALNNTTYILATVAGFLQNFLYGFTGLRIGERGLTPEYPPVLPPAWKTLTLKNLSFKGRRFDYVVSHDRMGGVQAAMWPATTGPSRTQ
jgi:trehalose/maltose hydrolase-like predicted phosphorylase